MGVMSYEETPDVSCMAVTPACSKGALGTWRSQCSARTLSRDHAAFEEGTSSLVNRRGRGVCRSVLKLRRGFGKTHEGKPRSEPDWGNPTVRDRRGACGIVVSMGAGLRPNGKLLDRPPDPAVTCAPHFYPDRARACGYHTSFHLLLLFVVSALLAALAGCLMAACSGVVAPDVFSPLLATEVILWVAVGGRGTIGGPVIAAVAFTLLKQRVSSYSTELWPLLLGALFLGCVLFLPDGLRARKAAINLRRFWRAMTARRALSGRAVREEGGNG